MRKIVDVNSPGFITNKQEQALMKAFESFAESDEITTPYRDRLGSWFQRGISCQHVWKPAPAQDDVVAWFRKNFEEEDIGPGEYCAKCGATCLRESGNTRFGPDVGEPVIWAYDGVSYFFGRVPRSRRQEQF